MLNSIRSMMGGGHSGFGGFGDPTTVINEKIINENPASDQSNLARDAGVNDIDSSRDRSDDNSRSGFFDTSSNDVDHDDVDHDDMDLDSDDFGNDDGGSDYV